MRSVTHISRLFCARHKFHIWKTLSVTSEAHFTTFVPRHLISCIHTASNNAYKRESLCASYKKDQALCLNVYRTMAGHSHWQNIKSTKEAATAKYQAVVGSYIGLMKGAISDGGPDPEKNKKLSNILTRMKKANIPKADIQRYLENATKKAANTQTMYFEIRGPSGSTFVLEVESENPKTSRDLVNNLMKKTTGRICQSASVESFFDAKGVITVPVTKDMQVSNMDEYLEMAIETGAEDVILTKNENPDDDDDSEYVLKFHCDDKTYRKVAKEIEDLYDLQISSCEVELFPKHWVLIDSETDIAECRLIAEKLQKHKEFVKLFDNISLPEDRES